MKVLHLIKTTAGAAWAFRQVQELTGLGLTIEVVLPDENGMAERYRAMGVHVHVMTTDLAALKNPVDFWNARRAFIQLVEASRPDLIHSHFVGTTLFSRLVLRNSGPRRVFQVPGPLHLENPLTRELDLRSATEKDSWLASSRAVMRRYSSRVPAERLGLAYYGLDFDELRARAAPLDLRRQLAIPASRRIIGMVAFVYPPKRWLGQRRGIKGHEDLIAAARILVDRGQDVCCVIVGGAWGHADAYAKKIAALGKQELGDRFFWLGHRSDVPSVYKNFDVAVHPSLSENVGAAAESLPLHIPTVATRVGGLTDVVREGESGWLADPASPTSLAQAIGQALAEPAEAVRRARNGARLVETLLDIQTTARQTLDFYDQQLAGYAGR